MCFPCVQGWKESPRPEGVTIAKPGCKPVFVPKLALPAMASPGDQGEIPCLEASLHLLKHVFTLPAAFQIMISASAQSFRSMLDWTHFEQRHMEIHIAIAGPDLLYLMMMPQEHSQKGQECC